MLKHKKSDGCLYNTEFMLAALITIYRDTNKSEMYQELLLDSLAGIIDEVAQFIETTQRSQWVKNQYRYKKVSSHG